MKRRLLLGSAWIGGAALVVLHLDFWRPRRLEPWFGWLPDELAYRIAFIGLAWLFMLFICAWVWPEEPNS